MANLKKERVNMKRETELLLLGTSAIFKNPASAVEGLAGVAILFRQAGDDVDRAIRIELSIDEALVITNAFTDFIDRYPDNKSSG